jgi:hypothetical protein
LTAVRPEPLAAMGVDAALLARRVFLPENVGTVATAGVASTLAVLGASVVGANPLFGAPAAHAPTKIILMASRPNLARSSLGGEQLNIRPTHLGEADELSSRADTADF